MAQSNPTLIRGRGDGDVVRACERVTGELLSGPNPDANPNPIRGGAKRRGRGRRSVTVSVTVAGRDDTRG